MNWLNAFDPSTSSWLCLALLHSVWQVSLLAAAAWVVDRLLRGRAVQRSYAVHVAALAASVVLLPVTYAVVRLSESRAMAVSAGEVPRIPQPVRSDPSKQSPIAEPDPTVTASDSAGARQAAPRLASRPTSLALADVAPWLAVLYVAGVALMVARLVRSMLASERLRRRAQPIVAGPLVDALQRLVTAWSLRVTPALAQAERMITPKLVGLLRPTILLPASAMSGLSASELELILMHELAHVRRHDMWVNLLQRLAEAALFFNPPLWYLSRRIGTLREYCCDELACSGARARDAATPLSYARALVRVVEIGKPSRVTGGELTALAAAGASPSELRRRVSRLLGEPLREPAPLSRGGFSVLAAAALLLAFGPAVFMRDLAQANDQPPAVDEALPGIKHTVAEKFSFGAKARVLALGTHGDGPQKWWDAQGELIDPVPFTWKAEEAGTSRHDVWRRVVLRIEDLPKDADVRYETVPATSYWGGTINLNDKKRAKNYFTRCFTVPPETSRIGLRVGIANGPWRTVSAAKNLPMAMGSRTEKGSVSVVFSDAFTRPEGLVVVVSHDVFDEVFRVIAVDKKGETHSSAYSGGMSAGKVYQTRPTFPGLSLKDVERFEFQVRDFEWVEFKDLPLEPGKVAQK
jgi:beta-lactamase regulating signal transducer with metallopeptidase domain